MAPALFLSVEQRVQPKRAVADRIERIVRAGFEPMLQQDFLRLQRIGGVGGVDDDGVAADVGKVLDVVLHVEFVGAAVAAADDHDIVLGDVDHRHRVVDRRMHDIDGAVGERGALAFRALGELQVDVQPVPGEEAVIDAT